MKNKVQAYWFNKGQFWIWRSKSRNERQKKIILFSSTEYFSFLFLQKTNKQLLVYIFTQWVPPPPPILFDLLFFIFNVENKYVYHKS